MQSINPALLAIAAFVNFFTIRISGLFLPDQYYFSFSAFLFDTRDLDKPIAITIKLMMPFVVAFLIAISVLMLRKARNDHEFSVDRIDAMLETQLSLTLAFSAMFVSVLMAWPNILLWDILVMAELQPYRLLFLAAYFAYFVSVFYFAMAGANAAFAAFGSRLGSGITLSFLSTRPFVQPAWELATGALSASLATFLATRVG
jgi:hypothetical protein